jgi:hypothetical protein
MKRKRLLIIIPLLLVVIGTIGYWGVRQALANGWIRAGQYDIRSEGTLQVGDLAPDLSLEAVDGTGPRSLSEFYDDTPLVLVFGSYT